MEGMAEDEWGEDDLCANPLSCVQLFVTPWTAAPGFFAFTLSWSLLKLMSIESVKPSNHFILYCPLLLPSVFHSIRVFSNELALLIRWPKYWTFSFSINPSNEYSGLISFMIDWFDLLDVQGTLKILLQNHSWKASDLWHSAFFTVKLSDPCVITGKTMASDYPIWTFALKVMSFFNMLSRFVIVFLPRTKHLLNSMVTVMVFSDFGAQENKICHCFHFSPFYLPWSDGTRCHDLSFLNVELQANVFTLLFYPHEEAL